MLLVVETSAVCEHRLTVVWPEAEPEAIRDGYFTLIIFPSVSCSELEESARF